MNKFKRKLHKDRYGIIRGSIGLCLLIALCLGVFVSVQVKNNVAAEKSHAALAAQQVTAKFESLIAESTHMLLGSADILDQARSSEEDVLSSMVAYGNFSNAEIVSASVSADKDDIVVFQAGENLHMSCALENGDRLVGWIPSALIGEVLTNAFPADYGLLVYNSQNGNFLINHTDFDAAGYYDILLNLNENGDLEELLRSADGEALVQQNLFQMDGGYYIAQQGTSVAPWSIALVISEAVLHNEAWNGRQMLICAVVAELLVLIFFVMHTLYVQRRIMLSSNNTKRAMAMSEHMLNLVANDARLTSFVYHRENDSILTWYDGSNLLQGEEAHAHGITSLAKICRLVDDETERIYDALADLREQSCVEVQLRGFSEAHDERYWKLTLHTIQDNDGIVLCSIRDCTSMLIAQDREEQEHEYYANVQKKSSSIWAINVSKNRWKVEHHKRDWLPKALNMRDNCWNDYNADLNGSMRNFLHPSDLDDYMSNMDAAGLMDAFRNGRNEFTQDYRIRCGLDQAYEWHRMQVRIWQDAKSGDVIANLYVFNVDAKKKAELERDERRKMLQQTLTALGGIYQGLYYVDIDQDLAYTARSLGDDVVDRLCMPYNAWVEKYIAESVHPENQDALRQLLSAYMIRRNLTEETHMQLQKYKRRINDDVYGSAEIIIQPARFENGTVKEIVIAIRYLAHE